MPQAQFSCYSLVLEFVIGSFIIGSWCVFTHFIGVLIFLLTKYLCDCLLPRPLTNWEENDGNLTVMAESRTQGIGETVEQETQ